MGDKTWGNANLDSLDVPDAWKSRPDWAAGRVMGSEKGQVIMLWIVAIGTSLMFLFFFKPWSNDAGFLSNLFYIFELISLGFFVRAGWETFRLKRFGDPVLELSGVPIPPGGSVEGRINLSSGMDKAPEFTLTLACIHRKVTHDAKNSHVSETVLWSNKSKTNILLGGILPISIPVPADQPPTGGDRMRDSILWRLTVKAPFFGVPFLEKYELPVFNASTDAKR